MAEYTALAPLFTDIADAIRSKTGETGKITANTFPEQINNITSVSNILNGKIQTFTAEGNISKNNFVYGKPHSGSIDLLEGNASYITIDGLSYNSSTYYRYVFLSNPLNGAIGFFTNRSNDSVSIYKISFTSENRKIVSASSGGYLGAFRAGTTSSRSAPTVLIKRLTDFKFLIVSAGQYDTSIKCTIITFTEDYTSFTSLSSSALLSYGSYSSGLSFFATDSEVVCTYSTVANDDDYYYSICAWHYDDEGVTVTYQKGADFSYNCSVYQADADYFWLNVFSKGKQKLPIKNFVISDTFTDTAYLSGNTSTNNETGTIYRDGVYYSVSETGNAYVKSSSNSLEFKTITVDSILTGQNGFFTNDEIPMYYGFIASGTGSNDYSALTTYPLTFVKNESVTTYGSALYMGTGYPDLRKNVGRAISSDRCYTYFFIEQRIYTANASPTIITSQTPYCCGVAIENGTGAVKCISGWNI